MHACTHMCTHTHTYAHTTTTTRASKALNEGVSSSSHEKLLATVWCQQASERVHQNLNSLTAANNLKLDESVSSIAKEIIGHGGAVATHPLGL